MSLKALEENARALVASVKEQIAALDGPAELSDLVSSKKKRGGEPPLQLRYSVLTKLMCSSLRNPMGVVRHYIQLRRRGE
jgi:hypothetical protein